MIRENQLFTFLIIFVSTTFGASGKFTGWGDTILHHVGNPHTIWGENFLFISKPVIMLLIAAIITIVMSILGTTKYRKNINAKPSGLSQIYEILMDFINKEIVIPNIGKNYVKSWAPLAMTFFVFILTCNLLGLIPFFEKLNLHTDGGGSTVTANFGVTAGLALITFFSIIIAGIKKHGFSGYWISMIPSGVPKPVLIILIPIEIMGMFVRPFALMMRLGANMTAGHIGMIAIFALPVILSGGAEVATGIEGSSINLFMGFFAAFVSVILNVGIYFLEFIVCLVQAYVFTLLSSVFIGMAIHADH
jgi:F-type H+-transporting ATPase subunit a